MDETFTWGFAIWEVHLQGAGYGSRRIMDVWGSILDLYELVLLLSRYVWVADKRNVFLDIGSQVSSCYDTR